MFRRIFAIAAVALGIAAAAPLHAQQPDAPRPGRSWTRPDVAQGQGGRRHRRIRRRRRRMMMRRIGARRMRAQRMRVWRNRL